MNGAIYFEPRDVWAKRVTDEKSLAYRRSTLGQKLPSASSEVMD